MFSFLLGGWSGKILFVRAGRLLLMFVFLPHDATIYGVAARRGAEDVPNLPHDAFG